jgi:hypothetical protein
MNEILLAVSLVVGAVLIAIGAGVIYFPAGLIVGGALVGTLGWLFFGEIPDAKAPAK